MLASSEEVDKESNWPVALIASLSWIFIDLTNGKIKIYF